MKEKQWCVVECGRIDWEMGAFYAWKSRIPTAESREEDADIGRLITFKWLIDEGTCIASNGVDWCGNGINIGGAFSWFLHVFSPDPWYWRHIHGKVQAIGGILPMRWVWRDHEDVPISMAVHHIHGCDGISMNICDPWVRCNMLMQFHDMPTIE